MLVGDGTSMRRVRSFMKFRVGHVCLLFQSEEKTYRFLWGEEYGDYSYDSETFAVKSRHRVWGETYRAGDIMQMELRGIDEWDALRMRETCRMLAHAGLGKNICESKGSLRRLSGERSANAVLRVLRAGGLCASLDTGRLLNCDELLWAVRGEAHTDKV